MLRGIISIFNKLFSWNQEKLFQFLCILFICVHFLSWSLNCICIWNFSKMICSTFQSFKLNCKSSFCAVLYIEAIGFIKSHQQSTATHRRNPWGIRIEMFNEDTGLWVNLRSLDGSQFYFIPVILWNCPDWAGAG